MTLADLKAGGLLDGSDSALAEAAAILEADREKAAEMPWVARVALGFGAWLSGIFFTGFLFVLLDLQDELSMTVIGLVTVIGSVFLLRRAKGIFLEQLALALGLAGHLLFFISLHDVGSNELIGPFIGASILCFPIYWLSNHSVQRFLSVLWIWLTGWSAGALEWRDVPMMIPYLVLFGSLAVSLIVLSGWKPTARSVWRPAMWASITGLLGMLFWQTTAGLGIWPVFGVGAALAILGVVWWLARPEGKKPGGFLVFAVLLIGLGVAGAPGVVVALGLMVIARARGDRVLEWIAVGALALFLIAFYYHLNITLVQKSIILMITGAAFLGYRLRWGRSVAPSAAKDGEGSVRGRRFQAIVIAVNCLLVLVVINGAILKKQRVVDTGRTVFLELAPVDPRSLMQGDYMALAYAMPQTSEFLGAMGSAPTRGALWIKLDDRKVATFSRIADGDAAPGENEARLKYRKWRRGWRFGIESFFFQEGLAELYERAKYAELRVSPNGEAVLVDLRGEKRERLVPDGDD